MQQDPELLEMLSQIKMMKLIVNGITEPKDIEIITTMQQGLPDAIAQFKEILELLEETQGICQSKIQELTNA